VAAVPARRALLLISQILFGLTAASVARAGDARPLDLAVSSQCPDREMLESQLAPLLGVRTPGLDSSVRVEVSDLGDSYRVRVGTAERQVEDPQRDCQERAKVSAVFIALNLPARAPEPPPPQAPRGAAPQPRPPAVRASQTQLVLQLLGSVEHAPELSATGKGLYVGAALRRGRVDLTLHAGMFAPLGVVVPERETTAYELWRFPSSLTIGFMTDDRGLSVGIAGGLALDLLRFRGVDLPNPDSGLRVNPGLLLALPLRLHASRHVAAVLMPTLALFPRTYIVRLEPTRQLDESPRFWLGARIGLETSALGG
jgi:hypothetical protein